MPIYATNNQVLKNYTELPCTFVYHDKDRSTHRFKPDMSKSLDEDRYHGTCFSSQFVAAQLMEKLT